MKTIFYLIKFLSVKKKSVHIQLYMYYTRTVRSKGQYQAGWRTKKYFEGIVELSFTFSINCQYVSRSGGLVKAQSFGSVLVFYGSGSRLKSDNGAGSCLKLSTNVFVSFAESLKNGGFKEHSVLLFDTKRNQLKIKSTK